MRTFSLPAVLSDSLRAAGLLLVLAGCHNSAYRVATQANDYAYLFARAERVCGAKLATGSTPDCFGAKEALRDYIGTLDLADAAVARKGALKLTEAQLKADGAAALKAVKALGVVP